LDADAGSDDSEFGGLDSEDPLLLRAHSSHKSKGKARAATPFGVLASNEPDLDAGGDPDPEDSDDELEHVLPVGAAISARSGRHGARHIPPDTAAGASVSAGPRSSVRAPAGAAASVAGASAKGRARRAMPASRPVPAAASSNHASSGVGSKAQRPRSKRKRGLRHRFTRKKRSRAREQ
jgi:hypothetical protein